MHLGNWANIATHFLHQRTVSVVGSIIVRLAGLQVNWIGFDETRKSVVIWLHWTTETGDKLFSGLSPFIECYLHRYIKEFNAQSLDKSKRGLQLSKGKFCKMAFLFDTCPVWPNRTIFESFCHKLYLKSSHHVSWHFRLFWKTSFIK